MYFPWDVSMLVTSRALSRGIRLLHSESITFTTINFIGGLKVLLDFVTLAHLHTSRAQTPMQSNLLEAPQGLEYDIEREWYYGNKDKERLGPFSFKEMKEFWKEQEINETTRCWAQGLDGWKPLRDVAQLKWCLFATGNALMNETELAALVLSKKHITIYGNISYIILIIYSYRYFS